MEFNLPQWVALLISGGVVTWMLQIIAEGARSKHADKRLATNIINAQLDPLLKAADALCAAAL